MPYTIQEQIIKSTISNSQKTTVVDKTNTELSRRNKVDKIALEGEVVIAATTATWSGVSGVGKPTDNATVGATWGTNLNSIPSRLADTAPDNSLAFTNDFIGFHASGTNWPIKIANVSGVGNFYAGDGGSNYMDWNGTTLTIHGVFSGIDSNLKTVSASGTMPGSISLEGNQLWEDTIDSDAAYILINYKGYQGGTTRERHLVLGDGKGNNVIMIDYDGANFMGSKVNFPNCPTSDPHVAGQLWRDGTTLKWSAG